MFSKKEESQNHWDEIATSYHKVSSLSSAHIDKFEFVADYLTEKKFRTVVDAGCGSGILEKTLNRKKFTGKIYALDSSKRMIKIAENLVKGRNIKFQFHDLDINLPFLDGEMDCLVIINVFFLLKDPDKFLMEVNRILASNGHFIIINPKPTGNDSQFIREYFRGEKISGATKKFIKSILNIRHIQRMIKSEKKIEKMHDKGEIEFQGVDDIIKAVSLKGFESEYVGDIQAKQNWIFILKKA